MEFYKDEASTLWENISDPLGLGYVKMYSSKILTGLTWALPVLGAAIQQRQATRESCPGYSASNVQTTSTGLTADLTLAGAACNVFGDDVRDLRLLVNYDSSMRIPHLRGNENSFSPFSQNPDYTSRLKTLERLPTRCRSVSSQHLVMNLPCLHLTLPWCTLTRRPRSASP